MRECASACVFGVCASVRLCVCASECLCLRVLSPSGAAGPPSLCDVQPPPPSVIQLDNRRPLSNGVTSRTGAGCRPSLLLLSAGRPCVVVVV
jgi:hypothetical protein